MRWVFLTLGIIVVLVGAVFILQGLSVITWGFMGSGHTLWTIIGSVVAVVGILMIVGMATRRNVKAA
jgi:uncharacterized integral membrane protein